MISFSNINKQYGKQLLFVDASFQLNPGEKVGLVGPNGAGKTTLFRMVTPVRLTFALALELSADSTHTPTALWAHAIQNAGHHLGARLSCTPSD
jgi:ATPase subunit of ABC transporter with duplicated ATPase domains